MKNLLFRTLVAVLLAALIIVLFAPGYAKWASAPLLAVCVAIGVRISIESYKP